MSLTLITRGYCPHCEQKVEVVEPCDGQIVITKTPLLPPSETAMGEIVELYPAEPVRAHPAGTA